MRIVPEALWSAAHGRLSGTRAAYVRARHGDARGRPVNGAEGRYLLTGLGQCGICDGGMFVHTRGPWRRGAPTYGCMTYHTRRRVVCHQRTVTTAATSQGAKIAAMPSQASQRRT